MKIRKIVLMGLLLFCSGCSRNGWHWQRVTPEFRQQLAAQKMAANDSVITAILRLNKPFDTAVRNDLSALEVVVLNTENNLVTVQATEKALEKLTAKSYTAYIMLPQ
jgi:hypothetical protein